MNTWTTADLSEPGRPPGSVKGLLYNRPSDTLVAAMARPPDPLPPIERLYYRRLPGEEYHSVGVRHELESQEDAHCCERTPYLIFNEMRFREPEPRRTPVHLESVVKGKGFPLPPKGWGGDWLGIRRFNLEMGEDEGVLDRESLRPPSPYTSGWVSRILSVSADGSGAVCRVGLTPGGGVDYYVAEVSLADGIRRLIARLSRVFL